MSIVSHSSLRVESADRKQKVPQINIYGDAGSLARLGLVMRVVVSAPAGSANAEPEVQPKSVMVNALLDTGATQTSIDARIAKALGLNPIGFVPIGTAGGRRTSAIFVADVAFPNTGFAPRKMMPVGSCDLSFDPESGTSSNQNIGALIGRDIISRWVIVWNGPNASVTICD